MEATAEDIRSSEDFRERRAGIFRLEPRRLFRFLFAYWDSALEIYFCQAGGRKNFIAKIAKEGAENAEKSMNPDCLP
jgi:hypothetical protein